jgi:hypothetical protein
MLCGGEAMGLFIILFFVKKKSRVEFNRTTVVKLLI